METGKGSIFFSLYEWHPGIRINLWALPNFALFPPSLSYLYLTSHINHSEISRFDPKNPPYRACDAPPANSNRLTRWSRLRRDCDDRFWWRSAGDEVRGRPRRDPSRRPRRPGGDDRFRCSRRSNPDSGCPAFGSFWGLRRPRLSAAVWAVSSEPMK